MNAKSLICVLSALTWFSCSQLQTTSPSEGTVIGGAPGRNDSPVVQILPFGTQCSAVFVEANTALTAAHCFGSSLDVTYLGVRGKAIVTGESVVDAKDFAIVLFEKEVAPSIATIGLDSVSDGSVGYFAGYGCSDPSNTMNGVGVLRVASVKLNGLSPRGTIQTELSTEVGGCYGDSGGGLFVNDQLIGILVGGEMAGTNQTGLLPQTIHFVDLNSAIARDYMRHAVRLGARIPGF